MSDVLELEPTGRRPGARRGRGADGARLGGSSFEGYSRRARVILSIVTGIAGAGAFAAAALVTDAQVDEGEEAITVTNDARAVPVLVPASSATGFATVGSSYGTTEWALATREAVLGSWGAVTVGPDGEEVATAEAEWLVHDPRRTDPGAPVFADRCLGDESTGCPTDEAVRGVILDGRSLPANSVELHAFPYGDVESSRSCDFAEIGDGELPLAVVTSNPGAVRVVVSVGDEALGDEVVVETSDEERDEWDEWMERPVGVRPRASFVTHCLSVARPPAGVMARVTATATDAEDDLVNTDIWVGSIGEDATPVSITPIDSTLARVDVALGPGRGEATVHSVPRSLLGGTTTCDRVGDEVVAAANGWRRGATAVTSASEPGRLPWTEELPRVQRTTLPLWEGEANLVCIDVFDGVTRSSVETWVSPPDARRLVLSVTQVQLQSEVAAGPINVTARFAELGWTPCAVSLPGGGVGITNPGSAGLLCSSGGDTGALDGGGAVAELAVRVGDGTAHTGRIALSARTVPDPDGEESYRLPIPRPDLTGRLCVPGAEEPGCEPADSTNIVGSLVVTARWNGGASGADRWSVSSAP